jgi:hypothetical protein
MRFWVWRRGFLAPKMAVMIIAINPVDLIVSFPWPRSKPQSEFSIKSYGRLKLRWSNFDFYFFSLFSFLFVSLSLSPLFLYKKIDDKGLLIREISVFKFYFLDCCIGCYLKWFFIVVIIWINVLSVIIFKIIF